MLTEYEQNALLKGFPNAELSYETIVHNKVQTADFVLAIPDGKKFFAWFTVYKRQNVCVLMEIGYNKQICSIQIAHCCFCDALAFGTIFYGTIFKYDNHRFFSVENLLHYKGKDCCHWSFDCKLETLGQIFSREIQQRAFTRNSVVFGLPMFRMSIADLLKQVPLLPYKIKYMQFREKKKGHGNDCFNMVYNPNASLTDSNFQRSQGPRTNVSRENQQIVFQIKPDIQNDIYHLFVYSGVNNGGDDGYYGVAYVPDYKSSVMMNKLFRNIKENASLDALEESDAEEEFEDVREDKFVYLDRVYNMVCEYNYKFKRWTPLRIAQKNERVVTRDDLKRMNIAV